ncbi:HAD superfamily hydrolase [Pyronema omphalodes]|nr:HAD superfamily hydrolase [Pyronema omphalodes]
MSLLAASLRPCGRTRLISSSLRRFQTAVNTPKAPPAFAFAFDIDGVLLHGSTPLPGAKKTLDYLNHNKIEYLLLTNGGGLSEAHRVQELSRLLDVPLSTQQFVQSHTPFQRHASAIPRVLAVGGKKDNCRHVASGYGFKDVIIPADVIHTHPAASPFSEPGAYENIGRTLKGGEKVDAIMVYNDPRDWASDLQVVIDVLLSKDGEIGTRRSIKEVLEQGHVPLYFSNPDLWWANEYSLPRLGQGGFRAALEGVWRAVTGGELKAETIGKPHTETYKYAEEVLMRWRKERTGDAEIKRVYMVGDNPASDIRGANNFTQGRAQWVSCLLRTGVFRDGEDNAGAHHIADNVESAVMWAVEREKNMGTI